MNSILYFIVWAALLQGLFLALIYIFSKKHGSFANTLLGLFLIAIVIEAITAIHPFRTIGTYTLAEYFALPDVILFIPILFLHFVLEKLGSSHKYRLFLKVNYFVALCISLITLLNLYLFFFESSSISSTFDFSVVYWFHFGVKSYAFLITVYAFFIAWQETRRYKILVQNEFSDYNLLQINWLQYLIYLLLPVVVLWGVALLRVVIVTDFSDDFDIPIFGLIALFLYYLSYRAYLHPNLFERLPESILEKESAKPNISEDRGTKENSGRIEKLMTENEYYLDHDLTIGTFAREVNISPRKISTCINQDLGKNFNEWVNDFRVKKAKELLEQDTDYRLSIEGIGLESGFKSRSALYAAFKNKLGCSPGEYRKSNFPVH
ncbi:helix-turn-helix domain-containing protein [Allomuricauda sp. SCSIO 65647]|uniref:AraC family transcriptional regulator n=1 Tax=Allomuricauda sp. SCSIO 65647 TaxID=2908843 RepID=UPI001F176EE9|nr:helix-turn-helix domain-containing protein [Muricauda sp. SCSIO 65647]UJH67792.1 helix-turn-helix domain-containing protein [Muricauda sp. SCSIO 65647]